MPGEHDQPPKGRAHRVFHSVSLDISPLRLSRDYRLLWFGEALSITGMQATAVALLVQVYAITGSAAMVGLLGLVEFVPLVIGTTIGGPFIDRHDRRKILLLAQAAMLIGTSVLLLSAVMEDPPLWMIYAAAGFVSLFDGIDAPTRTAMVPNLVDAQRLPAAMALTTTLYSVGTIAGPAIAGVMIGIFGVKAAYALDVVTYVAAAILILMMRPSPPRISAEPKASSTWAALKEGLDYLKGRRVIQSTFTIDLIAMVFGLPEAVFPILATTRFGGKPAVVGAMFTSLAVGSLIASLTSGWVSKVKHQGRAVVWAVVVWGAGIAAFGLVDEWLWVALGLLALAGAADTISAIFRGTILQTSVPDELRGRLSSVHFLVVAGGPRLGNLEAGLVTALTSPTFAIVSGGVACIVGAIVNAKLVPEFWNYHAGDDTKRADREEVADE